MSIDFVISSNTEKFHLSKKLIVQQALVQSFKFKILEPRNSLGFVSDRFWSLNAFHWQSLLSYGYIAISDRCWYIVWGRDNRCWLIQASSDTYLLRVISFPGISLSFHRSNLSVLRVHSTEVRYKNIFEWDFWKGLSRYINAIFWIAIIDQCQLAVLFGRDAVTFVGHSNKMVDIFDPSSLNWVYIFLMRLWQPLKSS
jgi:hypothetical protein